MTETKSILPDKLPELTYSIDEDFVSISPRYEQFQLAKLESGTTDQQIKWAEMICRAVNCHDKLVRALHLAAVRLESGTAKEIEFNRGIAERCRAALKKAESINQH